MVRWADSDFSKKKTHISYFTKGTYIYQVTYLHQIESNHTQKNLVSVTIEWRVIILIHCSDSEDGGCTHVQRKLLTNLQIVMADDTVGRRISYKMSGYLRLISKIISSDLAQASRLLYQQKKK
jgi:Uri superfamily endonuclease